MEDVHYLILNRLLLVCHSIYRTPWNWAHQRVLCCWNRPTTRWHQTGANYQDIQRGNYYQYYIIPKINRSVLLIVITCMIVYITLLKLDYLDRMFYLHGTSPLFSQLMHSTAFLAHSCPLTVQFTLHSYLPEVLFLFQSYNQYSNKLQSIVHWFNLFSPVVNQSNRMFK